MGKASVSNISVSPRFVVVPKALAMAPLSVVASQFAILPSSPSRFCPLAPLLLQKLAPYCLSILPRSSYSSSVTPSGGIALPPCLVSNSLDRCNYRRDRMVTMSAHKTSGFPSLRDHTTLRLGPYRAFAKQSFLSFRGACGRVWVSLLYVSMNCFLTCLGNIILGARRGGIFLWIRGV